MIYTNDNMICWSTAHKCTQRIKILSSRKTKTMVLLSLHQALIMILTRNNSTFVFMLQHTPQHHSCWSIFFEDFIPEIKHQSLRVLQKYSTCIYLHHKIYSRAEYRLKIVKISKKDPSICMVDVLSWAHQPA